MTRRASKRPPGEGLHLKLVNGETVRLLRFEATRLMVHRYMLAVALTIWIALTLTDPSGNATLTPLGVRLLQYGAGTTTVMGSLIAIYFGSEYLFGGKGRIVVLSHLPVILFVTITGLAVSELVAFGLTGEMRVTLKIFAILVVFYFVIIEIALQLIIWLFLPSMLAELRGQTTAPPPVPRDAILRAAGHQIPSTAVLHIEAQGNYVAIVTDNRQYEVPGPFSALLDQLPGELGLRVHRSHWVARRAVLAHRRKGRELVLDLSYGGLANVALPRQAEVIDWLTRTTVTAGAHPPTPASDATQGQALRPVHRGETPPRP